MPKSSPSFIFFAIVWHFANFLVCSAPNPTLNNLALTQGPSPLFGQSPKFRIQMKSEEQKSNANLVKNVPNRRHSAHGKKEIGALKMPTEAIESQILPKIEINLKKEVHRQNATNADISPNFKCSLNDYLSAVNSFHGFYHKVPTKTMAKIAHNLLLAVLSYPNFDQQPIFDGILTFDRFSVICPNEFEFGAEELATGNLKIEMNDAAEIVGDPRERSMPTDRRTNQQMIWLKDVLFMSPEQLKENRTFTTGKDLVWFVGLLLYRMLFNNKHPMDSWESKRRLDMQFMAKMHAIDVELKQYNMAKQGDFVPNDFGIRPLKPKARWMWMPERDETGEMALVEAQIGIEQEYITQLRSIVTHSLHNYQKMDFNFARFASDQEDNKQGKLIELAKLCLQTFPEHRMAISFLSQMLVQMSSN